MDLKKLNGYYFFLNYNIYNIMDLKFKLRPLQRIECAYIDSGFNLILGK